jgi:hypothetical protein
MDFEVESDYPTNFPKNCLERFKPNEDGRLKFQKLTWSDGSMAETIQIAFE